MEGLVRSEAALSAQVPPGHCSYTRAFFHAVYSWRMQTAHGR